MNQFSEELKEPPTPVFLDRYPDENDVLGWLKINSDNIFHGQLIRSAITRIQELESALVEETKRANCWEETVNALEAQQAIMHDELLSELAEREAECLHLRRLLENFKPSVLEKISNTSPYRSNAAGYYSQVKQVLSTPPKVSYLDQWVKLKNIPLAKA